MRQPKTYQSLYEEGRSNSKILPTIYAWPTIWVDLLSNVPFLLLWYYYTLDYDCIYKERAWHNLSLPWPETIDYMGPVWTSLFERALFVVWTLQVLATVAVVMFHLRTPHHPKFYVGTANKISIISHIIGGSIANFGSWIGFVTGRTSIIKIASLAGIFLHAPAAFWQSRNLHGRREIMQPLYYFLDFFLLLKYIEVWFDHGSFASVIAFGYAVNMFAMVRVLFRCMLWIGMDYDTSYDISLIMAVIGNLPVVLGPFGCIQLVASLFIWNVMLNVLLPGYRSLIQVNRTVGDVFPDTFRGKKVNFKAQMKRSRKILSGADSREVVAHATHAVIAGDDGLIDIHEITELFEGWGLPDAKKVAHSVFLTADENNDGHVDYEEFKRNLWFVWSRIYAIGEAEKEEDGLTHGTSCVQDLPGDLKREDSRKVD